MCNRAYLAFRWSEGGSPAKPQASVVLSKSKGNDIPIEDDEDTLKTSHSTSWYVKMYSIRLIACLEFTWQPL